MLWQGAGAPTEKNSLTDLRIPTCMAHLSKSTNKLATKWEVITYSEGDDAMGTDYAETTTSKDIYTILKI